MSQITIDASLVSKLTANTAPVDLIDDSGRVVGRFTPTPNFAECEISLEELQRRMAPGRKRHTTDEVLAHLRKLNDTV